MRAQWVLILKKLLRYAALGVGFVVVLLLLVAAGLSMWGAWEWRSTRAELAAKGEKLTVAEYRAEPVAKGENFFDDPMWDEVEPIPRVAADGSYGGYVPGWPPSEWKPQFEEFDRKFTPEEVEAAKKKWPELAGVNFRGGRLGTMDGLRLDWGKKSEAWRRQAAGFVRETLKPGEPLMARTVELLKRPVARPPVVYFDELYVRDVTGQKVFELTEAFHVRALAELEQGETEAAARDVLILIALSQKTWGGPMLDISRVGMAALARGLEVIDLGVTRHAWTDGELAQFNEGLKKVEVLPLVLGAIRRARATANGQAEVLFHGGVEKFFMRMRSQRDRPREPGDSQYDGMTVWQECWMGALMKSYLAVLGRTDQARGNRLAQEVLERVGANGWKGLNTLALRNSVGSGFSAAWRAQILTSDGQTRMQHILQWMAKLQDKVVQARIVVGLERYYLTKGEYPEKLEGLVPEYLAELPREILTGEAMHYKRTEKGRYLLWANGWDGKDDGGKVVPYYEEMSNGDWVWGAK